MSKHKAAESKEPLEGCAPPSDGEVIDPRDQPEVDDLPADTPGGDLPPSESDDSRKSPARDVKPAEGQVAVEILDTNRKFVHVAVIDAPAPFRIDLGGQTYEQCSGGRENEPRRYVPVA